MCGIVGIVELDLSRRPDEDAVLSMCRAIEYRGPDDRGVVIQDNAALGMQRLSIIDLVSGHQPITNEDHTVWTVLNGEIYNYRELRGQLIDRGHSFQTRSDTEVLVHGYEEYDVDILRMLDGMFGFAIWDCKQKRLLLARDQIGIKPLYYYLDEKKLIFASELLPILSCGISELSTEVDPAALNLYMTYGNVPAPYTPYKKIRKLLPGFYLELESAKIDIKPYWRVCWPEEGISYGNRQVEQESLEQFEAVLHRSVRSHLVSDVPIGAFLSGGIDSSTVVAVAAQHTAGPIHTFSIGFSDSEYDESRYAKTISNSIGSEHHEFVLSESDILGHLPSIMSGFDEPFSDSSGIPTYFVSKLAREKVKVVLSGDGGDELFNGYKHHRVLAEKYLASHATANPLVHKIAQWGYSLCISRDFGFSKFMNMEPLMRAGLFFRSKAMTYWPYFLAESYAHVPVRFRVMILGDWHCLSKEQQFYSQIGVADCIDDPYKALSFFDLVNYLPNDILTKVDRMSMKNSLEVRVPLLCRDMVNFALGLPQEMKIHNGEQKYIMRKYLKQRLFSDEVYQLITRPKHGFRVPIGKIMEKLKSQIRAVLLEDNVFHRGLGLSARGIEKLFNARAQNRVSGKTIWTMYCLYLWWERNGIGRKSLRNSI